MKRYVLLTLMVTVIIILSYLNIPLIGDTVRSMITLFINDLFPYLFPFSLLLILLLALGGAEIMAYLLQTISLPLFRISGSGFIALTSGMLGGYPMTALTVSSLLKEGKISTIEGKRLLHCASFASPAFIFGALGAYLSSHTVLILALSMWLAGLLMLLTGRHESEGSLPWLTKSIIKEQLKKTFNNLQWTPLLIRAIKTSFVNMIIVFGTMVFFTLPAEMILQQDSLFFQFLGGLLEFSRSSLIIAKESTGVINGLACTFLTTFGGASVLLQSHALVGDQTLSFVPFLGAKLTHALVASILFLLLI